MTEALYRSSTVPSTAFEDGTAVVSFEDYLLYVISSAAQLGEMVNGMRDRGHVTPGNDALG